MADFHVPRGEVPPLPQMPPIGKIIQGIILAVAVIVGWSMITSSFYVVNPSEVGVVQRFGKYVRTTTPGLRMKLPLGIETLTIVPKERVFTEEFGFRTKKTGAKSIYYSGDEPELRALAYDRYSINLGFEKNPFLAESFILTGDLNCAEVEWAVLYQIDDPVAFCFNVKDIRAAIRDISETVVRQVVGDATIDEILTFGKEQIQETARVRLQEILNGYGLGVEIQNLVLQDVNPPAEVKESFNEVNEAMQDKERITNQAGARYNQIIPKAKGEAEKTVQNAEGYQLNRVNMAKGDAERFLQTWNEYKNAQDITKRRLYLETMTEMLPHVKQKIIVDSKVKSILPLLDLPTDTEKGGAS